MTVTGGIRLRHGNFNFSDLPTITSKADSIPWRFSNAPIQIQAHLSLEDVVHVHGAEQLHRSVALEPECLSPHPTSKAGQL